MARGGWSRQPRDRRGRWTSVGAGVAKQTGGRGARLMSPGNQRDGGGRRISSGTGKPSGTVSGTKRGRSSDAADRAIKAADKARKAGPKVMTEAEYAAKVGGKTKYDHMSFAAENARAVGGRGKAAQRRYEQQEAKLSADIAKTKAQYDAAIKSGKIKAPSNSLARKAQGQADNPAVQAAKRLQAKTAAKRAQRADTASVNRPMRGSRGRALDAEISRNVNAQKAASRAASKARNRQFKSDQSRAKQLRNVHGATLAKSYAAKSGKAPADVMKAIQSMSPSKQIKLFKQHVKETRARK